MRRCGGWRSRSPDEGNCYATQLRGLDVPEATSTCPTDDLAGPGGFGTARGGPATSQPSESSRV